VISAVCMRNKTDIDQ